MLVDQVSIEASCRHCGDRCGAGAIAASGGVFCCEGCRSVYELLRTHGLCEFYAIDASAGRSQKGRAHAEDRFAGLDDSRVAAALIDFADERRTIATFSLPSIHCASCVWLLEQLWRFDAGIERSTVDLLRRSVRVEFRPRDTSLRAIAGLLASLGYEPAIEAEQTSREMPPSRRRLYLQLGIAGFAFGNMMAFSLPRYLNGGPVDPALQPPWTRSTVWIRTPGCSSAVWPANRRTRRAARWRRAGPLRARSTRGSKCRARGSAAA